MDGDQSLVTGNQIETPENGEMLVQRRLGIAGYLIANPEADQDADKDKFK